MSEEHTWPFTFISQLQGKQIAFPPIRLYEQLSPVTPTTMVLYSIVLQVTPNNFCAPFWLEHVMCSVWYQGSSVSFY